MDNLNWINIYRAKYGRSPRVLHIGNIANNAYNNAKILIEVGLECDVICYDYYHIMGTPEWEDADFTVGEIDQFNPNWASINLNGFKRPKWFVQGPLNLCLDYLLAKNRSDDLTSLNIWKELSEINRTTVPLKKFYVIKSNSKSFLKKIANAFSGRNTHLASKRLDTFLYLLKPNSIMFYVYFVYFLVFINISFVVNIFKFVLNINYYHTSVSGIDVRLDGELKKILKLINDTQSNIFPLSNKPLFCHDILASIDFKNFVKWKEIFSNYDVIIAYSTDGIYPLVANTPYIAFEHGTLRDLPYQDTVQGKLCAVTYSMANHVFVTNFDCKKSAEFLAPNKYSLINHPFDDEHSEGVLGANELRNNLLQELDSDFLFFFPTRHDWVEGTGYADKANDIFLNAFGRLRKLGYRVGMVCCDWGQNVENSKELLLSLNAEKYVQWGNPMATIAFERTALACDCVVDQFKLGSFGGILFKAMAAGSPVLTYLNEEMIADQFSEAPPVINCKNEQDIIESVQSIYGNLELIDILGIKSQEWIKNHHSKKDIVNFQLTQFKLLMQHKLV
jgi:hypothetical protein